MGKKKEVKLERKIHRDFSLDEFDVFTMDLQCEGAADERTSIVSELTRREIQITELMHNAKLDSDLGSKLYDVREGIKIAIDIIRKMKNFEDRCGCPECGAI